MGFDHIYSWDDNKLELLIKIRGHHIKFVADEIFREYVEYTHPNYPDQSRAIGFVGSKLYTLAYEFVDDGYDYYIDLKTYWPASSAEIKLFEKGVF